LLHPPAADRSDTAITRPHVQPPTLVSLADLPRIECHSSRDAAFQSAPQDERNTTSRHNALPHSNSPENRHDNPRRHGHTTIPWARPMGTLAVQAGVQILTYRQHPRVSRSGAGVQGDGSPPRRRGVQGRRPWFSPGGVQGRGGPVDRPRRRRNREDQRPVLGPPEASRKMGDSGRSSTVFNGILWT